MPCKQMVVLLLSGLIVQSFLVVYYRRKSANSKFRIESSLL